MAAASCILILQSGFGGNIWFSSLGVILRESEHDFSPHLEVVLFL